LRNLFSLIVAVLFLGALVGILLRYYLRARATAQTTWDELLNRLMWVDRDKIARIALDVVDESGERRQGESAFLLEPSAVWSLLGGLEGLEVLEHNCHVLVELAAYVQKRYPEALVVAEQLRLNAREIEWHVSRLRGAAKTGNLQSSFADYSQRAVVTYYLMTKHVLALYEHASIPELADLQRAL
jgi:hypothetical protein